jgi:hypothetical protein
MRLLVMLGALCAVVARGGEHGVLGGGQLSRQVVATGARFGTGVARQPRKRVIAIGVAVVALIAGTGTYILSQGGGASRPTRRSARP